MYFIESLCCLSSSCVELPLFASRIYAGCFIISGVVDNKMSVLLYDTTGAQDVCINQFLVQHGYCQTAGLG